LTRGGRRGVPSGRHVGRPAGTTRGARGTRGADEAHAPASTFSLPPGVLPSLPVALRLVLAPWAASPWPPFSALWPSWPFWPFWPFSGSLRTSYSARSTLRVAVRNSVVVPGQTVVLRPLASRYQLVQPPLFHTVRVIRRCRAWFQAVIAPVRASSAT